MKKQPKRPEVSFVAFYLIWAKMHHLIVADVHIRVCNWLEQFWTELWIRKGVLKAFRGFGKSTTLALWQAWLIRKNPEFMRVLDRSADDATAKKLTAGTLDVLQRHPLCRGLINKKSVGADRFWAADNKDKRNPSVVGHGILSNITGSRSNLIVNDDTEVPKNIETPDLRVKLRKKLNDEVHIIMPGGKILYVGTDHTHNSVYNEKIEKGYETLIEPLFRHYKRHEQGGDTFIFNFPVNDKEELYVMTGIYESAKVYEPHEYELTLTETGGTIRLNEALNEGMPLDIAAGNQWPEYFNRDEVKFRREECLTLNAWDSQYQLQAKPLHEIRLNPDLMVPYDSEVEIRTVNNEVAISLDNTPLTTVRAHWDCSKGKKTSDESIFSMMFGDDHGRYYWHINDTLEGEVFDQCHRVADRVVEYQISAIVIETNGIGGFLPAVLRQVFKERGIEGCAVIEKNVSQNKTTRILQAFEPLLSAGLLHVHTKVLKGGLEEQMKDWQPTSKNQKDDKLDGGTGCILNMPNKIGKVVKAGDKVKEYQGFRPQGRTHEIGVAMGGARPPMGSGAGCYEVKTG